MTKGRLEAFSDGVIAVIITIMVLELKTPVGADWEALKGILPQLTCYILSFIYIGIYWNNHHHTMQIVQKVNGTILWANLHLLFWLSLVPVCTAWLGAHLWEPVPAAVYGVILLFAGCAYSLLVHALIAHHGKQSLLAKAIGSDFKGNISLVAYVLAIAAAFWNPVFSYVLYASVALLWFIPDQRIEKRLES